MSFLPLVERELRVVSRRKGTYWIRCGAALLSFIFLLPALMIAEAGGQKSGAGSLVFLWMTWYAAITCVLAGAFLGADAIAEERRDGTLGFLFLTDLKSYDVTLGKFVGSSLNAFYGLLAMAPILGLSVLGGGVTGGEFWRKSLALMNLLFFATALAILISARVKSETRPTFLAIGLVFGVWIGGAAAARFSTPVGGLSLPTVLFWLSMASPGEAFSLASEAGYLHRHTDFWHSLAISNAAGWIFLGLATWGLDNSMEDGRKGIFRTRKKRNRKLLEESPIVWLLDDSSVLRIGVWMLAGVSAIYCVSGPSSFLWSLLPFVFLLKVLFAICACRFFAEGRGSGALELLRTTPLAGKEMIDEQWKALRRIFLLPLCLIFGAHIVAAVAIKSNPYEKGINEIVIYKTLTYTADLFAIGWGGMLIALKCRKPGRAAWLTIVFLILIPAVLVCVPNLLIDAIVIAIASSMTQRELTAYLAVRREETRDQRAMIRS